jgi:hypothetical protein
MARRAGGVSREAVSGSEMGRALGPAFIAGPFDAGTSGVWAIVRNGGSPTPTMPPASRTQFLSHVRREAVADCRREHDVGTKICSSCPVQCANVSDDSAPLEPAARNTA